MGDEIKSAMEIAMEKIAKLEKATEGEKLKWKFAPVGEELAAKYLTDNQSITAKLSKYKESERKYVTAGACEVLVRNLRLPDTEITKKMNKKVLEGLKPLKTDKVGIENIYSNISKIFSHYLEQGEEQRRQVYTQLKADFEARIQKAMQQQTGTLTPVKIDVEKQPQFQEEWRGILNQMDSQYQQHLDGYKRELLKIT